MLPLDLTVSYAIPRAGVPSAASFRRWATAALVEHADEVQLAIRLVDIDEGRTLNREYRNKDYATNVLSFPAERPPGLPDNIPFPLLGDLILCAPVITREAHEQEKPLKAHYAHLTIHGVLHLLGWDHLHEPEAEAMEQHEREILARLGIVNPYCT